MSNRTVRQVVACLSLLWLAASAHAENNHFHAALSSVTAEDLYDHVNVLADDTLEGRAAGSRGGIAAARYIETLLRKLDLEPAGPDDSFTQPFAGNYRNLLARLPGSDAELSDEIILVGAHYDHVGYGTPQTSYGPVGYIHNGADDNASGVSVLMETIEALTRLPHAPRRTILFAFWDGEEQGLLGSKHFVVYPTVPMDHISVAFNIDMVGWLREGRLEVGGTRTGFGLRRLLASERLDERMWLDFNWELKENSDHWPFYQHGVPVVLLHTGLHDHYHRPSDDVERINHHGMRDVAAYLFDALYRAANAEELPRFRAAARGETPLTQRTREAASKPLPPRLGISFRDADPEPQASLAASTEGESKDLLATARETPLRNEEPHRMGVIVTEIRPGSPADQSALRPGDHIIAMNGEEVENEAHLLDLVLRAPSSVELAVARGDEDVETVAVELAGPPVRLGISWREDTSEPGTVYLTRVVPGSPAARAGLKLHDRIYNVDDQAFAGSAGFAELVQSKLSSEQSEISLLTERRGRLLEVHVSL